MALYHLSVKMVSRGKGHSVIAGAAYRAGEKLRNDRTGKIHDYSGREDVAHSEILAPSIAPQWAKDRQTHWNQVDAVEKRKDSQLAREVQVGLLREFTLDQNKELLRTFVQKQFVDRGMVADMSIHWNDNNPHAHILLTTREINSDGFGKKNRNWNKKELLPQFRAMRAGFHSDFWGLKPTQGLNSSRLKGSNHQTGTFCAKKGLFEPIWCHFPIVGGVKIVRTQSLVGSQRSRVGNPYL